MTEATQNQSRVPALSARFQEALPELSVSWQSEEMPDPSIVVLNDELARELGIDPQWLRTDEGLAFLLGKNLPEGGPPGGARLCRPPVRWLLPQVG